MTSNGFAATIRSICIILVICICLSTVPGVRAADSSTNLEHGTDAVVTSPNAAFARIENGICELLTTKTVATGHDAHTARLSGREICNRIIDTSDTTITLYSCHVNPTTALQYSSMAPEQLGAMIVSGRADSFDQWDTSWSVQIRVSENYDEQTLDVGSHHYDFFRPISTSGQVLYRDAQVVLTMGVLQQQCYGMMYSAADPNTYIGQYPITNPHLQSTQCPYPQLNTTYSMVANQTCWYDLGPTPSCVWPRWTVTMKRGTGLPWTVYADHMYGNPYPI